MPLVVSLRERTFVPVEVDSIRLETVREQSADTVKSTQVQVGNRRQPLSDFFNVAGSAADQTLVWEGDCSHVKGIATGLAGGTVRVEGNAGMHLGAEMTGGEVIVSGNAGDWIGAQMHGGRIRIRGNAGDLVGAAYRGDRRGMTGGEILIDGNAGDEIGHSMRRGLVAIGGTAGNAVGFNMIAGSIIVLGNAGFRPGAGMRRGTLALLGPHAPPELPPTFRNCCTYRPTFLRTYLAHLQRHKLAVPADLYDCEIERYAGDFLEFGKGEILIRARHG